MKRFTFGAAALLVAGANLISAQQHAVTPPDIKAALDSISSADMRGNLSFLASDELQGRYTPSPGLDVAAEFIASQFRGAGLEPGGDHDYFQTADMVDRHMAKLESPLMLKGGGQTITIPAQSISINDESAAANIKDASVVVLPSRDPALLKGLELAGKAVVVPADPWTKVAPAQRMATFMKMREFDTAVGRSNAALEVLVNPRRQFSGAGRLITADRAREHAVPSIYVHSDELGKWLEQGKAPSDTRVSVDIPGPGDRHVVLKNVVAVLRGSDPALKDTCVLLTAHYDHIGTTETGAHMSENRTTNPNDHIYNGANDDGSGTVSVIEIAKALAKLNPHPRRTLVFMTFFGEERGEIGSNYYGSHPIFPVAKTVADINLEQVGRTDSTNGPQVNTASLTGYDYSDVTKFFEQAGRETGIKVYLDKEASDAYFTRSDNAMLAEQGVPAHSLTVAFDYPDYHGLGDEWPKIDYQNMARVDRMVALALIDIANSAKAPEWNAQNPKTLPFREAQQKLHEQKP